MAITRAARHLTFTAVNEGIALAPTMRVVGIAFQGTGLTAGQRVLLTDSATPGAGNVLADYQVSAATDNADLWGGRTPQTVGGLSVATGTVAGTWVLTVSVLD